MFFQKPLLCLGHTQNNMVILKVIWRTTGTRAWTIKTIRLSRSLTKEWTSGLKIVNRKGSLPEWHSQNTCQVYKTWPEIFIQMNYTGLIHWLDVTSKVVFFHLIKFCRNLSNHLVLWKKMSLLGEGADGCVFQVLDTLSNSKLNLNHKKIKCTWISSNFCSWSNNYFKGVF